MKIRPIFRGSLAFRLAAVYGLLSAVVVAALGLGIHLLVAHHLRAQADEELAALADFYAAYAASAAPDEDGLAAMAPQIVGFFAPQAGYNVRLFSARTGGLLAATHEANPLPSTVTLQALGRVRPTLYLAPSTDVQGRQYAARTVASGDGSELAVVELSRDVSDRLGFLSDLRRTLVVAGGSALVVFMAASVLLASRMTRPLRQMESATRVIATGDFEQRIPVASSDEIGRLAVSINQMASDLGRLEAVRREFIAQISHDLRTPLTSIKGFVVNLQEIAPENLQASLVTLDEQTDRLIRLVNELLTLSRLQRGQLRMRRIATDLTTVVQSAMDLFRVKAQRQGIDLMMVSAGDTRTATDTRVQGDPDRLQQVVINLLDNALRATPPGGSIRMEISGRREEVIVTIADTGRGLTAEEADRAFEPYYRGAGGGAGLGLSIAQQIVESHGGKIWLAPRQEGGTEASFSVVRRAP